MLPDFLPIKRKISKDIISYLRAKINYDDVLLRQIRKQHQPEGARFTLKSFDGYIQESGYKKLFSGFRVSSDEIIKNGHLAIKQHIDKMAQSFIIQMKKMMFNKLNEITERTGNVVSAQGELTADNLLEVFDKTQMDFDEMGKPVNMSIVMHPETWDKIRSCFITTSGLL